ncbi:MAG: hypothetical protein FJW34_22360 [Acidobacteria bacterium]|nr:hypothetical protein [Acidobacteriota bacterium]
MNLETLCAASERHLDELLTRELGGIGDDFASRARRVAENLPDEFAQPVTRLLELRHRLGESGAREPDAELVGRYCFACGAVHEKLRAFTQARLEVESAIMGMDSVQTMPLQTGQSDQLSRFLAARDRLFRKVADVTLKFLLIGLGLLLLGLLIGVV